MPKSKLTVEEVLEQFKQHIPQPERHYSTQIDWKDWVNLEHWLTSTLTTLQTQHREEVDTLNRLLDEAIFSLDNHETETYLQEKRKALKPN